MTTDECRECGYDRYTCDCDPIEVDGYGDDLTVYCHDCDLLAENLTLDQAKALAAQCRAKHTTQTGDTT